MVKYIIKRLLMMIPIILAVTVIIFTLMNFVPGDPATIQASGQVLTEEQLDAIRESMGLNQPFLTRLLITSKTCSCTSTSVFPTQTEARSARSC